MKVILPKIPAGLRESTDDPAIFQAEEHVERLIIRGVDIVNQTAPKMKFDETALDRVVAVNAALDSITMLDTEIRGCDLSAAVLTSGVFKRVRFTNCRMAGVDLSRAALTNVTFSGCKLDMANFRFARLEQVIFEDCTFIEADFQVAHLSHVEFNNCTLEQVIFEQCTMIEVDARGSQLNNIRGWQYVRGLTIDHVQLMNIAPELAHELGLKLK